jgi:hypothetical protein
MDGIMNKRHACVSNEDIARLEDKKKILKKMQHQQATPIAP